MQLLNKKKKTEKTALDMDVEKKINRYPKFMRKQLRILYVDYKNGKLVFPEGFDKGKFLDKE